MDLTEKQIRALQLRRTGKKLREVAAALAISTGRARQLIERANLIERQSAWAEGLPSRYLSVLLARGINNRDRLEDAVANGTLARLPGIGPKCHDTIVEWLRIR